MGSNMAKNIVKQLHNKPFIKKNDLKKKKHLSGGETNVIAPKK